MDKGATAYPTDQLPGPAVNLARRAKKLADSKKGRHVIELLVTRHGQWLIIVDGGEIEDLGNE